MNGRDLPIGDDDLQAFTDDRLTPERREAVLAYLADHPEVAAVVRADMDLRDALRERLAHVAREPIPARLRVANIATARSLRGSARGWAVAAGIVLFLTGTGAGWLGRGWLAGPSPAGSSPASADAGASRDALAAYRTFAGEVVHPVEVKADQEAHLVQWLSRRLGKPIRAPDLKPEGFGLVGGRLLPAGDVAAAMFMYEDGAGKRLSLYLRAGEAGETTAFRFEGAGEVLAFSWLDRGLSYVVTARTEKARLLTVARAVEEQTRDGTGRSGPL